jgi:hypothetical protein
MGDALANAQIVFQGHRLTIELLRYARTYAPDEASTAAGLAMNFIAFQRDPDALDGQQGRR